MSLMHISGQPGTISVRVTRFTSPLTGTLNSAQVRLMEVHFPIKASQQTIQFQLQIASLQELQQIQDYVRSHHRSALASGADVAADPLVYFNWPQRNINNWSGLILGIEAGGSRFEIATKINIQVMLVDSLLSTRVFSSSSGTPFSNIIGAEQKSPWPDGIIPPLGVVKDGGVTIPPTPSPSSGNGGNGNSHGASTDF